MGKIGVGLAVAVLLSFGGISVAYAVPSPVVACKVLEVFVTNTGSKEVGVLCASPLATFTNNNPVSYLQIVSTDVNAEKFERIATAALLTGRSINVVVDIAGAGNSLGCGAGNCRTPLSVGIR
jgi:hypothetical protein